jgi:hypothetical protein
MKTICLILLAFVAKAQIVTTEEEYNFWRTVTKKS